MDDQNENAREDRMKLLQTVGAMATSAGLLLALALGTAGCSGEKIQWMTGKVVEVRFLKANEQWGAYCVKSRDTITTAVEVELADGRRVVVGNNDCPQCALYKAGDVVSIRRLTFGDNDERYAWLLESGTPR